MLRNEIAVRFCHLCPFVGVVELIADVLNLRISRAASNSAAELAPRANAERAKLQEGISELRQQLAQAGSDM